MGSRFFLRESKFNPLLFNMVAQGSGCKVCFL